MVESEEAPWQDRDGVFLVADVVDIRDVGVDIIRQGLIANLERSPSMTTVRSKVAKSYPRHSIAHRLEVNRRRQMQGEVDRVDQSECGTCASIAFSICGTSADHAAHRGSDRRSSHGSHRTSRLWCSLRPKPVLRSYEGASSTASRSTETPLTLRARWQTRSESAETS